MTNKCLFSVILRLDAASKRSGQCPICLRAVINGHRKIIALNLYCKASDWDGDGDRIRKSVPGAADTNLIIDNAISKATAIVTEFRLTDKELTADRFRELFLDTASRLDFLNYMENGIKKRHRLGLISTKVKIQEEVTLRRLREFSPTIYFNQLTAEKLQEFDQWALRFLRKWEASKKGKPLKSNGLNTRGKYLKHIKIYVRLALKEGIRFKNPFEDGEVKVYKVTSDRGSLSQEQLNALVNLYNEAQLPQIDMDVLQRFLFSCFTGLRISDISQITTDMLVDGKLHFPPVKGRRRAQRQSLPLSETAKGFITSIAGKIFRPLSDQKVNMHLKPLATLAKINKPITFHWARHTFATLWLERGGDVVSLSKYLGHSKLETTMIYVHMNDARLLEQVSLMDGIIPSPASGS